jgi:hypothetical protein
MPGGTLRDRTHSRCRMVRSQQLSRPSMIGLTRAGTLNVVRSSALALKVALKRYYKPQKQHT